MALVKLKPAFKDYLWGGTKLKEEFHKESDYKIVAESWELSTHKDGESIIDSGEHKGSTLSEYLQILGTQALGTIGNTFTNFPMLIKFIDAKGNLSIQVHPDNEYALRVEKEYGKTEMWYILEAEEGASLYYGTKNEISKEEFRTRIENDTILDVLKQVPVHKGDVFFIEAGTIHAIGEGIVICEIQQNSNSTYRVYDFGRVGADGKPRELHIEKAIDVSNLKPLASDFKPCGEKEVKDGFTRAMMATCEYFTTYIYEVETQANVVVDEKSFASVVIVEGEGFIKQGDVQLPMRKGDTFFISAGSGEVIVEGTCQFILSRV
ncbi:type I phosphomannose isomerase catalytic subunit [Amedibacillus sp. YH-ame6]